MYGLPVTPGFTPVHVVAVSLLLIAVASIIPGVVVAVSLLLIAVASIIPGVVIAVSLFLVAVASIIPGVVGCSYHVGVAWSVHAPLASITEYYRTLSARRAVPFRFPVPFPLAVFQFIELSIFPAC